MAQRERPLSPHLFIYRPQLTSVLSISHRFTGVGLGVGALFLVWWLLAAAAGPEAYALVEAFFGSWIGIVFLAGFSFSLFYHLANGIRHMFWDAGLGFENETITRTGIVMLLAAIVLTAGAWALALAGGGVT